MSETKTGTFAINVWAGPVTVGETPTGALYVRAERPRTHRLRVATPDEIRRDVYAPLARIAEALLKSGPKFALQGVKRDVRYIAEDYGPTTTPGFVPVGPQQYGPDDFDFWEYMRLAVDTTAHVQTLGRLDDKGFANLPSYLGAQDKQLEALWAPDTLLWRSKRKAPNRPPEYALEYLERHPQLDPQRQLDEYSHFLFKNPWRYLSGLHSLSGSGPRFRQMLGDAFGRRVENGIRASRLHFTPARGLQIHGNVALAVHYALMLDWFHASDIGLCEGCGRYFIRRSKYGAKTCSENCRRNKNRRARRA